MTARTLLAAAIVVAASASPATAGDAVKQPTIPPAIAARIPDTGRLIALHSFDDGVVVMKLGRTGPVELLRDTSLGVEGAHWLDARTLLVMGRDDAGNVVIRAITDGKVDAARTLTVKPTEWKLPRGKAFGDAPQFEPYVGAGGALWLEACLQRDEDAPGDVCKKAAWLRADAAPRKTVLKRPKGVQPFGARLSVKALPKLPAPAGYAAKLVKVKGTKIKGIECAGPRGKRVWSGDTFDETGGVFEADALQWISATPPLLAAEGVASDPGGDRREVRVFEACGARPLEIFHWLGDGMWAKSGRDESWRFFVDDQPIAIIASEWALDAAPR